MISNLPKILIFFCLLFSSQLHAGEIWRESFSVPSKGIWGAGSGAIQTDFSGINWLLQYANVSMVDAGDYAKTVTTSGGRFEVVDVTGEVAWVSPTIDISGYEKLDIQLLASETGSTTNTEQKYMKVFFKIDGGAEIQFAENGNSSGNWGSATAAHKDISGQTLQIVVRMANNFAADKVILDEIVVNAEEIPAEPILAGDVVINEVLFNPKVGGSDYVEIYNSSRNEIAVSRLFLASRDSKLALTQVYPLSNRKIGLKPDGYLVLTKDSAGVLAFYYSECSGCFIQMEKFPSYNNDEDFVVLLDENLNVIDELHYTDKLHHPLLADEEGIALERSSVTGETNDANNWHSASTAVGYGTPGYKNSQAENANRPKVSFAPESFSPNFDGYNDEYEIVYELEKPGYVANITIFDAAGRFVMKLANNEILGTSGKFTWNGNDETGQHQNLGVYVVLVKIFSITGETWHFKDGVVLTDMTE